MKNHTGAVARDVDNQMPGKQSFIIDHKKSEKFNYQSPQILNILNHKPRMKACTPIPNSTQGYSTFFSEKILHPETEISPENVHSNSKKPNPSVSNVQKNKTNVKRKNIHTSVSSEKFLGCFLLKREETAISCHPD